MVWVSFFFFSLKVRESGRGWGVVGRVGGWGVPFSKLRFSFFEREYHPSFAQPGCRAEKKKVPFLAIFCFFSCVLSKKGQKITISHLSRKGRPDSKKTISIQGATRKLGFFDFEHPFLGWWEMVANAEKPVAETDADLAPLPGQ